MYTTEEIKNKLKIIIRFNNYIKNVDFSNDKYEYQPANKNGTEIATLYDKNKAMKQISNEDIRYVRIFKPIEIEISNENRDEIIKAIDYEVKKLLPYRKIN